MVSAEQEQLIHYNMLSHNNLVLTMHILRFSIKHDAHFLRGCEFS